MFQVLCAAYDDGDESVLHKDTDFVWAQFPDVFPVPKTMPGTTLALMHICSM